MWEKNENIYRSSWGLPLDVRSFLQDELDYSQFPVRCGLHIEERPGGVNFSILGRGGGVNLVEREEYVKWDINTNERRDIAARLKDRFPDSTFRSEDRLVLIFLMVIRVRYFVTLNLKILSIFYGDKLKGGREMIILSVRPSQKRTGV